MRHGGRYHRRRWSCCRRSSSSRSAKGEAPSCCCCRCRGRCRRCCCAKVEGHRRRLFCCLTRLAWPRLFDSTRSLDFALARTLGPSSYPPAGKYCKIRVNGKNMGACMTWADRSQIEMRARQMMLQCERASRAPNARGQTDGQTKRGCEDCPRPGRPSDHTERRSEHCTS